MKQPAGNLSVGLRNPWRIKGESAQGVEKAIRPLTQTRQSEMIETETGGPVQCLRRVRVPDGVTFYRLETQE
jgi:hypothetical protein